MPSLPPTAPRLRVLIDVNIFMDVVEMRAGWLHSALVCGLAQAGIVEGFVSVLTVVILYWLRRRAGRSEAEARQDALAIVTGMQMVALDEVALQAAVASPLPDFEDNLQASAAQSAACQYIVTRNAAHYAGAAVPAITPEELVRLLFPATS